MGTNPLRVNSVFILHFAKTAQEKQKQVQEYEVHVGEQSRNNKWSNTCSNRARGPININVLRIVFSLQLERLPR